MKKYIARLRQYITANPIQFDDDCDHPALDSLYWHYSECHNMSNAKTKAASRALNEHLGDLSFRENDRVFSLTGALCAEHARIAFLAGLQLGAQLILELTESAVLGMNKYIDALKRHVAENPPNYGDGDT